MRPVRLLRPTEYSHLAWIPSSTLPPWPFLTKCRRFSCGVPMLFNATGPAHSMREDWNSLSDHRAIGTAQSLFTNHSSSPGAPFFQPDGAHIFNKLISFLRAQYPAFGFREVLTPTMYKQSLWEQSGHWANYKDDMFTVTKTSSHKSEVAPTVVSGGQMQGENHLHDAAESEDFGLKPMNCPGHCLLFQSQRRSYRDLPVRYADFGPLHRDEISGALSGLTRVRRFHQDDGHIFCRPNQVKEEISRSLDFVRLVYQTLGFENYALVLSTRPGKDCMGEVGEWNRAENQLKEALDASGKFWKTNTGDGAFYGPKIDVMVRDSGGKQHQTATIQLDFQLPKRFRLGYEVPAPEQEAMDEPILDPISRQTTGTVTPVMIHRAVLGSLERFMALLLEHHHGQLPFWLSPRQVIILTVTDNLPVIQYGERLKKILSDMTDDKLPRAIDRPSYVIDLDDSGNSVSRKIVRARKQKYNLICVVGQRNFAGQEMEGTWPTLDLTVTAQPNQRKIWEAIEKIRPGSQAPLHKDRATGAAFKTETSVVRLRIDQCKQLIRTLSDRYL